jgi:hypothetical protein
MALKQINFGPVVVDVKKVPVGRCVCPMYSILSICATKVRIAMANVAKQ